MPLPLGKKIIEFTKKKYSLLRKKERFLPRDERAGGMLLLEDEFGHRESSSRTI